MGGLLTFLHGWEAEESTLRLIGTARGEGCRSVFGFGGRG